MHSSDTVHALKARLTFKRTNNFGADKRLVTVDRNGVANFTFISSLKLTGQGESCVIFTGERVPCSSVNNVNLPIVRRLSAKQVSSSTRPRTDLKDTQVSCSLTRTISAFLNLS